MFIIFTLLDSSLTLDLSPFSLTEPSFLALVVGSHLLVVVGVNGGSEALCGFQWQICDGSETLCGFQWLIRSSLYVNGWLEALFINFFLTFFESFIGVGLVMDLLWVCDWILLCLVCGYFDLWRTCLLLVGGGRCCWWLWVCGWVWYGYLCKLD